MWTEKHMVLHVPFAGTNDKQVKEIYICHNASALGMHLRCFRRHLQQSQFNAVHLIYVVSGFLMRYKTRSQAIAKIADRTASQQTIQ